MTSEVDVAIVGAGPYGLSLAAHLQALGVEYRVFGRPMDTWRHHMPEGMLLKSDGFASSLSDLEGQYTLERFCLEHSIPYHDTVLPVSLETFAAYGMSFRHRNVSRLDEHLVVALSRRGDRFCLALENETSIRAHRVVLAVGITHFAYIPPAWRKISPEFLSHSFDNRDLSPLLGRKIAIVGSGASAIDLAGLLHERGCDVHLISRRQALAFADPPSGPRRSLWDRIRRPSSGLGPSWRSRLCTDAPLLFHWMPESFRFGVVRRHLGPAAGWPMREKVLGRVHISSGSEVIGIAIKSGKIELEIGNREGRGKVLAADHLIAATGYLVDLRAVPFLSAGLLAELVQEQNCPVLSSNFESSIPGLFFIGPVAASNFGPLMRFSFGNAFVSKRVARYLTRVANLGRSHVRRSPERSLAA
jgi:thioredoxin reductase